MTEENISLRQFFEEVPPGQTKDVALKTKLLSRYLDGKPYYRIVLPDISIYCDHEETCGRMQMHKGMVEVDMQSKGSNESFVFYLCRNCNRGFKTFAARFSLDPGEQTGTVFKYGEEPQFGPPNPPRLISLFRADKDTFLKGRRAEINRWV